jgi:hypothetical protein
MATIKLQPSGAVVIKDGKVSCGCCEPMIIFYSYDTDSSLGANYNQCPDVGKPCGGAEVASCAGLVVSGFLYSRQWPSIPVGRTPKAKIYAGARLDNWGNIGSAFSNNQGGSLGPCALGITEGDVVNTAQVDPDKRMKLPFSATNSPAGGPYGILAAVIEWYWE